MAIHNSYPDIMFAVASLEDLEPCKTMTDILAPVKHTNWMLSAWNSTLDPSV